MQKTLKEIAVLTGATLHGDAKCLITSIAPIQSASEGQLTFLHNDKYHTYLSATKASAALIKKEFLDECPTNALVVDDPYYAYAVLARLFDDSGSLPKGVHSTAVIGEGCHIDKMARIAAHVVIGDHVEIGANTQIHSGTVIGSDSRIGKDGLLWANVTLYPRMQIGDRVILHSGCVIGADGFGFANHEKRWEKIPQLGRVVIGNDVEVGASTTIDRGSLEDTVIEEGVKIDNQIQIGHNAQIGTHTIIAGNAGIAGSATIGKYCMIGAGVGVVGHIELVDGVVLAAGTAVSKSIKEPGVYGSGLPSVKYGAWKRMVARLKHLDDFAKRLIALEKKCKSKDKN